MTNESLLNQDEDHIQIDENKDYYAELVGEGKKFKDEKALAKGKAYSDAHVTLLERKMDELTKDYLKEKENNGAGAKLQELLDKLEKTQQQLASREQTQNSNEDTKPAIRLDEVEALISDKIAKRDQTKMEEENYNQVKAKLQNVLGTNYKSILKEQSDSLGLSNEDVELMARRNPNLFYKTFDLNEKKPAESFQSPLRSDVQSGFTPKGGEKRTWSYYLKIKDKDPKAWLTDSKLRIQMDKDSQALGKDFFDV